MARRQPLVAIKALRQLIANPEDTERVFVILRALSGNAIADGGLVEAVSDVAHRFGKANQQAECQNKLNRFGHGERSFSSRFHL